MRRKPESEPKLYEYLRKYQDDPTSRVFAPLAESYRKAGLFKEAIEIAREGLRIHPTFTGGRVALARALFDQGLFSEVVDELRIVLNDAPDNLVAQRLMAESCLMLGQVSEALSAYKMLLYLNPADQETAQMVRELETQAYEKGTLVLTTTPVKTMDFSVTDARSAIDEDPDLKRRRWMKRVELLQDLLIRLDRYRSRLRSA